MISPRGSHPPSSQYYYHQVDISAGERLIPEYTIHPVVIIIITRWIPLQVDDQSQRIPSIQQSVLLSLGGYLCWWTISPSGYHPPNSQYYYHQVDTSAGGLLVPEDTIHPVVSTTNTRQIPLLVDYQSQRIPSTQQSIYYHQVDTSAGGRLVPEDNIHSIVSITITRWIPLLVDNQSQRIPSTRQSVLQSLGGYLSWWTISPSGYHPPNSQYCNHWVYNSAGRRLVPEDTIHPIVSITITRWIPLLVDYQSQRIPSTQQSVYYHQVDTSAGGRLISENTIHPVVSILSLGGYLCWWTISPRGYHPPSSQYYYHQVDTSAGGLLVPEDTIQPVVSITITRWIPLLVDDQSQRIPSTQQSVLLSLGRHLCWWTINSREYHPSSSHYYYHQVDTSAGGRLIPGDTIHPVVSITITGWIPLLVDDQSQWIQSTQ